MSDLPSQIIALLKDVIAPQLESVQASQAELRQETDRLKDNIEEFRREMQMRFTAIHAEIVACRQELEDTMVTIRERDADDEGAAQRKLRKRTIH